MMTVLIDSTNNTCANNESNKIIHSAGLSLGLPKWGEDDCGAKDGLVGEGTQEVVGIVGGVSVVDDLDI